MAKPRVLRTGATGYIAGQQLEVFRCQYRSIEEPLKPRERIASVGNTFPTLSASKCKRSDNHNRVRSSPGYTAQSAFGFSVGHSRHA
jgi:hypothetical protein